MALKIAFLFLMLAFYPLSVQAAGENSVGIPRFSGRPPPVLRACHAIFARCIIPIQGCLFVAASFRLAGDRVAFGSRLFVSDGVCVLVEDVKRMVVAFLQQ